MRLDSVSFLMTRFFITSRAHTFVAIRYIRAISSGTVPIKRQCSSKCSQTDSGFGAGVNLRVCPRSVEHPSEVDGDPGQHGRFAINRNPLYSNRNDVARITAAASSAMD